MQVLVASLYALCGAAGAAWAETPVAPSILISNVTIAEGDSGLTPFTATLSYGGHYSYQSMTVRVTATSTTASASDYVFAPTEVTLGGDAGTPTVSGFIVGDIEPESDETIYLSATVLPTDAGYQPYLYSSGGVITIKDDDQARASRLHVEGVTVLEGDEGLTQAEVRVVLEPASTSTVTVSYATKDGTALAKVDYLPTSGTLVFAPGEVLKTVTVDVVGDASYEPNETFKVALSAPSMALLGDIGDVVIANDDSLPPGLDALPPPDTVEPAVDAGAIVIQLDASGTTAADAQLDVQGRNSDLRPEASDTAPVPPTGNSDAATPRNAHFGSGCSCSTDRSGHSTGALLLLALPALVLWRRKRN